MKGKRKKHKSWIACILLLVTLISSVSMFSFESQAAGSTFDDASEEMDKIITITFMNKNKKTIAEGSFDVSDTEGLAGVFNTKTKIGDEDDLIYYCARYMYNPATISLDKEFEMSEINSSDKGEAVYCKWTVANQTYLMSTLKRYSGQKKDGVLFLPASIPQDIKEANNGENPYKEDMSKDLDYYNFPTFKGITLATAVRFVVHGAADSLIGWVSDTLGTSFDDIVGSISDVFSPNISYIKGLMQMEDSSGNQTDLFTTSVNAFRGVGASVAILIYLLTMMGALFGPLSGEENPLENVPRFLIALFLVFLSDKVMDQLLNIAKVFVDIFQTLGLVEHSNDSKFLITGLLDVKKIDVPIVLNVILVIIILKEFLQLMLEIIERYLVMMVMYFTAPLAFATYTSKKTSRVFSSFISMYFAQVVVYCITMWCINITLYLIEIAPDKCAGMKNTLEQIVYFFIIIGFLKIAQKIDSYLKDMGLTVAGTSANLGRAAMETVAMGYGLFRAGTGAYRLGKGAVRTSKALSGAANNMVFSKTNGTLGMPSKDAEKKATLMHNANLANRKIDSTKASNAEDLKNGVQKFVSTGGKEGIDPNSVKVNGRNGSADYFENGKKKKTLTWGDGKEVLPMVAASNSIVPKDAAQMPGMLSDAYEKMSSAKYGNSAISLEDAKISNAELSGLGLDGIDRSKLQVSRTPEGSLHIYGEGISAYSSRGASVPCSDLFQKSDLECLKLNDKYISEVNDEMFGNMYFQTSGPAKDGGVVLWDNNGSVQELGYVSFNHSDVRGGRQIDLGYGEVGTVTQAIDADVAKQYADKICNRSDSERLFKELGYDIDYESAKNYDSNALMNNVYTELKDMNGVPIYVAAVKPGIEYIQRDGAYISCSGQNLHRSNNSDITQIYVGRDKPRIIG